MNQKTKNALLPLLACIFLLPWVLYKCEKSKNQELKYENKKLEANVGALADTVRITKTKNNELEFDRKSFITDKISELEKLSSGLAAELKQTKGKPIFITKAGVNITTHDTIPILVSTSSAPCEGFIAGVDLDTTYSPGNTRKLQGAIIVNSDSSFVDLKEEIGLAAVTGLKENEKGDYEIFFRSKYPNLTITSLEGSYIPKNQLVKPVKRKHFSFGAQLGYSPITYLIDYKKLSVVNQITLGVGITYKLF